MGLAACCTLCTGRHSSNKVQRLVPAAPACLMNQMLTGRYACVLRLRDNSLGLQLLYHPGLLSYLSAQVLHLHGY